MHGHAMYAHESKEAEVRRLLACLGDPSRFRLVRVLAKSARCVGELAVAVGLSQSCTTRHLQALQRVGLVEGCREGRRVRFRLRAETPGLSELLAWVLVRQAGGGPAFVAAPDQAGGQVPHGPDRRFEGSPGATVAGEGAREPGRPEVSISTPEPTHESAGRPQTPGAAGGAAPPRLPAASRRAQELEDFLL